MNEDAKYVYVGSTNINKIIAVRNIFEPLGFIVVGVKSDSGVSSQPKTDEETLKGAINRAYNLTDGYFKIGLEAGIQETDGITFLINYGALIDENENIYLAGGTKIPLPKEIVDEIAKGYELKDAMEHIYHTKEINLKEGAIGFFTNNEINRQDIFEHIIKLLYGQYLHQHDLIDK